MKKILEKIAKGFPLNRHQMNYKIDKLRYNVPFGFKNFSIRAFFLKQYFKVFHNYSDSKI